MKSDEDKKKRGGEAEEDIRIDTGVCILYLFSVRHIRTFGSREEKEKNAADIRSDLSIQPFRVI